MGLLQPNPTIVAIAALETASELGRKWNPSLPTLAAVPTVW
jgi:hypothetical protein